MIPTVLTLIVSVCMAEKNISPSTNEIFFVTRVLLFG
jgi:hypothetical protein